MTTGALVLIGLSGVASAALTGLMRRYALRRQILDTPNHRSAHSRPTPRGGGLAIAVTIVVAGGIAAAAGWVPVRAWAAIAGGGMLVAAIGWIDDLRGASVRVRLLVHFAAAAWALAFLGGLPGMRVGDGGIALGWAGTLLAVVGIVWATNLYNFMDGLDGFAGTEAVMSAGVGGLLLTANGSAPLATLAFLIAAASAGFLAWNWPPAKIFMGDVGSGFLGYTLAVLAVASERMNGVPLIAWLILFGAFFFDATVTLFRRLLRGEAVWAAHFEHAYQRGLTARRSHADITISLIVVNAALAAAAAWMVFRPASWGAAVLTALALLVAVYLVVERTQRGASAG